MGADGAGDVEEGASGGGVGGAGDDGDSGIAAGADFGEEGDFSEQTGAETLGFAGAASVTEDFDAGAVGGGEEAHVFHQAEDGDIEFLEHGDAFTDDAEGGFLGGGDDDTAVEGHGLAEGELGVAGAGREVDEEGVEVAPVGLHEELLDRFNDHGAAPDHGLVIVDEEAETHEFDAVTGGGEEFFGAGDFGAFAATHHEGDAGAVDIAVE